MELIVFFFLPGIKMSVNPWLVENVHAFSFLNCPECIFKTKTEDMFKTHAVSNHPLSCMLFEKSTKTIIKEEPMSELELEQIAEESDKTLEELMHSEFGSPEHLDHVQVTLDKQNYYSYEKETIDTADSIKKKKTLKDLMHRENNCVDVKCKDKDIKIKLKPKSVSESLNYNATTSSIKNTESIVDGILSSDQQIEKSLQCSFPNCDFETSRKNSLDLHIKSHTSCKHCGEDFPGKRQLTVHLTTHKPKKRQLCGFCNREFNNLSNKLRHMKICKKAPGNIMERPKSVPSVILFPQKTPKVLPPKKAPGNYMCGCCNNDFSHLCQKDLNEHRQMCYAKFGKMVEPVNLEGQKSVPSGILFPPKVPKVSLPNFICEVCNNDFSYSCRKDLNEHRQMCSTNLDMMVEPELLIPSITIKEEIDP